MLVHLQDGMFKFFKSEKELMPFRFYDQRTVSGRYDTVPVELILVGILVTLLFTCMPRFLPCVEANTCNHDMQATTAFGLFSKTLNTEDATLWLV